MNALGVTLNQWPSGAGEEIVLLSQLLGEQS